MYFDSFADRNKKREKAMAYKAYETAAIDPLEPKCRKKAYGSEAEAREAIAHIRGIRRVRQMNTYKCSVCGCWHLTSIGKSI